MPPVSWRRDGGAEDNELDCLRASYACGMRVVTTGSPDVEAFVQAVAEEVRAGQAGFGLFFFSQSLFAAADLVEELDRRIAGLHYCGCSTAGEITPGGLEEGHAVAILFPAASFSVAYSMVRNLSSTGLDSVSGEVEQLRRAITERTGRRRPGNVFALSLIDGLSYAEEAVTSAIYLGLDDIPLIGGSAGDDLKFKSTTLIANGRVESDSAIILLVATDVPFHVFKTDNFVATDQKLVVTASDPDHRLVYEFNADPAAAEYAAAVGLAPDELTALSFASYPVVLRVGGEYFCRSIQKTNEDGSLSFFCAIDDGIVLSLAQATDMVVSTNTALKEAESRLGGIDMILGFDCVLRRLDAQNRQVTREMSELYRANKVIGFGTYGEQYRSMHLNQTFTGIAFGHRHAAE